MDDEMIISLYWQRNEDAITQTASAYGRRLQDLSFRIVTDTEDAQECVNDTYWKAWNAIPPERPVYFFAFLAKICRRLSLDLLDRRNAAKRKAEIVQLTSELELCIPDRRAAQTMETEELGKLLNSFLSTLPKESMLFFIRRYWYADSIQEIARRYGVGESKVKVQLHRCRGRLRAYLEKEGVRI